MAQDLQEQCQGKHLAEIVSKPVTRIGETKKSVQEATQLTPELSEQLDA